MDFGAVRKALFSTSPAGWVLMDYLGPVATALDPEFLCEMGRDLFPDKCMAVVAVPTAEDWRRASEMCEVRQAGGPDVIKRLAWLESGGGHG